MTPVQTEAMIVDYALRRLENGQWARSEAEYNQLVKRFQAAFPRSNAIERSPLQAMPPAGQERGVPDLGVHIHWKLPAGLRHGRQKEKDEAPAFPLVPNRWAVVRLWIDEQQQLKQKYWLVQSDLIQNPQPGGTNFLVRAIADNSLQWKQIGKVYPITPDAWPVVNAPNPGLTAIGLEDSTFSAYTTNNRHVFTVTDELDDLQKIIDDPDQPVTHFDLSYLVAGWYEQPEDDPLYQPPDQFDPAKLLTTLEELQLSIGGPAGLAQAEKAFQAWCQDKEETLAPLMLCFGAVHSIHWYGHKNEDQDKSRSASGKPAINRNDPATIPGIIIANSSMDALIRFITVKLKENKLPDAQVALAADLIYAYEKGVLDNFTQVGGEGMLHREIQKSWFDAEPGGTEWVISENKAPETEAAQKKMKEQFQTALKPLAGLNAAQESLNRQSAVLEAKRLELFTCLYGSKTATTQHRAEWLAKAEIINGQIRDIQVAIQQAVEQLDQFKQKIISILQIDSSKADRENDFSLKEQLLPVYWAPSDPVLLVHAAKTSEKINQGDVLDCRYTGQAIDSLTVHGTEQVIKVKIDAIPQAQHFPKELDMLLKEFILLNPAYSSWLNTEHAELLAVQQTMIWNPEKYKGFDAQLLAQQAGFNGLRPAFAAFQTYTHPWSPLFLDWMVYFFQKSELQPVATTKAGEWLQNWQLDDTNMDFAWNQQVAPPKVDQSRTAPYFWQEMGRSLITSEMPHILQSRLEALDSDQLNPVQKKVIDAVTALLGGFDIITQRMNGLNDLWLQYDIANPMPPELLRPKTGQIDMDVLAEQHFGIPQGKAIYHSGEPSPLNHFFPLRSGYLLPHYVRITDSFGIGLYPNGPYDPQELFIPSDTQAIPKGRGMDNPAIAGTRMAQLPPRLLQAARIRMEWIDGAATTDIPVVTQARQNTPVAGWIIPNHLDKSLMIFDQDGFLEGSLMFFERNNTFHVRKELDPVSGGDQNFNIKNPYLRAFVNRLLSFNKDDGAALSAFLQNIDVTTWITDPLGPREKQGMSALIGRPLAVVRARVGMEIKGTPIRLFDVSDPAAYQPEQPPDPFGLMEVDFPFYTGADNLPNNGLIGYFDTDDFDTFYVVADHATEETDFIRERANLTTRLNTSADDEKDRHYRHLSLILDYRGLVHTVSGLLPVFELGLPKELTEAALANMEVTFRTGPLIVDPYQLRMPKPNDIRGKLSWIYQSGVRIWQHDEPLNPDEDSWINSDLEQATESAAFPNHQRHQLAEGWLKLSEALKTSKQQKKK